MAVRVTNARSHVLVRDPNGPVLGNSSKQSALVRDADGPMLMNNVFQSVLVVTEHPGGVKDVWPTHVFEQTLIKEGGAPARVTNTYEQALIKEEGSPVRVLGIEHSILIEELPGSVYSPNIWHQTLAQTEAPIVQEKVSRVMHTSLVADLERGVQLTSVSLSQAILLTEPPSRDPERYKFIAPSTAHRKTERNPSEIISYTKIPQLTKQVAVDSPRIDPIDARSQTPTQTLWSSAVVQVDVLRPEEVRDRKRVRNIAVGTAVKTTPLNPIDVRPTFRLKNVSVMSGLSASYVNGEDIRSQCVVNAFKVETAAHSVGFTTFPKSLININAYKYETAHQKTDYLDPNDIKLKPVVAVPQIKQEFAHSSVWGSPELFRSLEVVNAFKIEAVHETASEDPSTIRSIPNALQIKSETVASTEYDPPQGFYPAGRINQLEMTITLASPNYGELPRSLQTVASVKSEMAIAGEYLNPVEVNWTTTVHQTVVQLAVFATYQEPSTVKPKRRSSSTRVLRPS